MPGDAATHEVEVNDSRGGERAGDVVVGSTGSILSDDVGRVAVIRCLPVLNKFDQDPRDEENEVPESSVIGGECERAKPGAERGLLFRWLGEYGDIGVVFEESPCSALK